MHTWFSRCRRNETGSACAIVVGSGVSARNATPRQSSISSAPATSLALRKDSRSMRSNPILAVAVVLLAGATHQIYAADAGPQGVSFCELVSNPSQFSSRTIRVRAIFAQGAEQFVLYDSACASGKTPIAVEFAQHYKGARRRLDRIVAKDRRAWVVVDGTFYGPEVAKVDPKLPDWLKNELQGTPKRYGHLGAFDSMFRILAVVSAAPVPPDVPQ